MALGKREDRAGHAQEQPDPQCRGLEGAFGRRDPRLADPHISLPRALDAKGLSESDIHRCCCRSRWLSRPLELRILNAGPRRTCA